MVGRGDVEDTSFERMVVVKTFSVVCRTVGEIDPGFKTKSSSGIGKSIFFKIRLNYIHYSVIF